MPVTSYLLASGPGYFHNFHLAAVAPEVETSWESQSQDSLTFDPVHSQETRAPKSDSLLRVCGLRSGNPPPLDLHKTWKKAMEAFHSDTGLRELVGVGGRGRLIGGEFASNLAGFFYNNTLNYIKHFNDDNILKLQCFKMFKALL